MGIKLMFTRLEAEVKRYNNKTGGKAYVQRCVKAIPWGIVITSGESVPILFEAFSKLKSILPDGNSPAVGPSTFITDDSQVERESLGIVWPDACLLLCIFHYLQAW